MPGKWYVPLGRYQAHLLIGALGFLSLFAAAAAIDLAVNCLGGRFISPWLFTTAEWTAKGICAMDIILYVVLVAVSTKEFLQGL
jgi:hypothetical protein